MTPQPVTETLLEPSPASGLFWALAFPDTPPFSGWEWRHFDLVHSQAKARIEADDRLPRFAQLVVTASDDSARIVTDGTAVAGVLPAYSHSMAEDREEIILWRFAMIEDHLVTGRRHPARTLITLWHAINNDGLAPSGPAALIELAIAHFAREVRTRLASLSAQLDALEEGLLTQHDSAGLATTGKRLGSIRRESVRLRRALAPVDRILHGDNEELPEWARCKEHDAADRVVHGALDDITALAERARSLHDELTTRLAEETNRRLYLVSMVTALALPAAFITGFFGMNTTGLLWSGDKASPYGTLYALGTCALAVLAMLAVLRWKKLL
jgi:zinc transporter